MKTIFLFLKHKKKKIVFIVFLVFSITHDLF